MCYYFFMQENFHEKLNTEKIYVNDDALSVLIKDFSNTGLKITILYNLTTSNVASELFKQIKGAMIRTVLIGESPFENNFKTNFNGCETILAVGDDDLISVAKYYAYMLNKALVIFPVGEFLDYTFSTQYSQVF